MERLSISEFRLFFWVFFEQLRVQLQAVSTLSVILSIMDHSQTKLAKE